MVRCLRIAALVTLAALMTLPGQSAERKPSKPTVAVKVIDGIFANEKGETTRFQVAAGGVVRIRNAQQNLSYKLHANLLSDGQVELRIQQFFDQEQKALMTEETLGSHLDGKFRTGSALPFSIALTGTSTKMATLKTNSRAKMAMEVEGEDKAIACCVSCGDGWTICCGVDLGYDLDWICCTIYSCIECTVCEIWI